MLQSYCEHERLIVITINTCGIAHRQQNESMLIKQYRDTIRVTKIIEDHRRRCFRRNNRDKEYRQNVDSTSTSNIEQAGRSV